MRMLIAGPDTMEFGWLIATWAPAVRHISRLFEAITVICRPEHQYLYEFATNFIPYSPKGTADRWLFNDRRVKIPGGISVPKEVIGDVVHISPSKEVCTKWKREFRRYGEVRPEDRYDLIIHARAEKKYAHKKNHRNRNWPVKSYVKVLKHLKLGRVCSIGTEKGASHVPGTEDLRGISLSRLCDIMASSRVLLSPSSGPAHLASHCGLPHVVMTYAKVEKAIGTTNKVRYEKLWNPLGTPCKVLDAHSWQPPVKLALKAVEKFL